MASKLTTNSVQNHRRRPVPKLKSRLFGGGPSQSQAALLQLAPAAAPPVSTTKSPAAAIAPPAFGAAIDALSGRNNSNNTNNKTANYKLAVGYEFAEQRRRREQRDLLYARTHPTCDYVKRTRPTTVQRHTDHKGHLVSALYDINSFIRSGSLPEPQRFHNPTLDLLWTEVATLPFDMPENRDPKQPPPSSYIWRHHALLLPDDLKSANYDRYEGPLPQPADLRVPPPTHQGRFNLRQWNNCVVNSKRQKPRLSPSLTTKPQPPPRTIIEDILDTKPKGDRNDLSQCLHKRRLTVGKWTRKASLDAVGKHVALITPENQHTDYSIA